VIRVEKLAGDIGSEVELAVKASFKEGGELVSGGKVTGHHRRRRPGSQNPGLQIQAQETVQENHRSPPVLHGSQDWQ
jgi:hypothetical protein